MEQIEGSGSTSCLRERTGGSAGATGAGMTEAAGISGVDPALARSGRSEAALEAGDQAFRPAALERHDRAVAAHAQAARRNA